MAGELLQEGMSETVRKVLSVSFGQRKEDVETWRWNEEVKESILREGLVKNKWNNHIE